MEKNSRDISIVLSGAAGQGIKSIEKILVRGFKEAGYHVYSYREYMSRVRGGSNSTQIRVSSGPVGSFTERIDILMPLNPGAAEHVEWRIGDETVIAGDRENIPEKYLEEGRSAVIPITEIARETGSELYSNTVAAGVLAMMMDCDFSVIENEIGSAFSSKSEDVIGKNIEALRKGYELGKEVIRRTGFSAEIPASGEPSGRYLISGVEALGMGAVSGGCNLISAYPMSPSTSLLVYLSENAEKFGIVSEQAEDEISAVNMAIGSWYAGGRALVVTAGGGFALMTEGLSLAAMLESPLVIIVGQRPAPATGLPTRTGQEDLEQVLYSGHGEFPRVVFTPGNLKDAIELTHRAFNMADKYQVPVIILTDQLFLDSTMDIEDLGLARLSDERHFIKTSAEYRRYEVTASGVSPRGIPGYGAGLVAADSDEHDEEGHITEDLHIRTNMVDKRLRKLRGLIDESLEPELYGPEEYRNLLIGWGSTYYAVLEALERLESSDTSFLYFKQIWPLHSSASGRLEKAEKRIIIENNATSQFGRLLRRETGFGMDEEILQYNGLPFSVERLTDEIGRKTAAAAGRGK